MTCPICARAPAPDHRPFCSRRCADVDLARWLNGSYAIPVEDDALPDEAGADAEIPLDRPGRLV